MKSGLIVGFAIISVLVGILALIYALKLYRGSTRAKRVLSPVHLYTIGVFVSVLLLFLPIYYICYDFGDKYNYIRPFLLAVHNSLRIFILDADFDIIQKSLSDQSELVRIPCSLYAAFLYVIAPLMTFSNVLSLFENAKGEIRFWLCRYKKIYIMSELNSKSVALAKSIYKSNTNSLIVFTDVFEQNEEEDYELLTEVKDIKAICLKRDIVYLNLQSKKPNVEIFLIGENESENVSQAVKITTELNAKNKKQNVKVFVFSKQDSASYIIDSLKYDNLIIYARANDYNDKTFKIRRINEVRQFVWDKVPQMNTFEIATKHNNTLSVVIAGMGSYGLEFFKTLIWYCQFDGYKLVLTVLDKKADTAEVESDIQTVIEHQCPDLLKNNRSTVDGDAYYDIEFVSGIDMTTSSFEKAAFYDGDDVEKAKIASRIKEANIVIVALGDDDLNIETAVNLRSFYDKVHEFSASEKTNLSDEPVQIYSIVYDEQKSGILHCNEYYEKSKFLTNHKKTPYHIHFIGEMSEQLNYKNIYNSELEARAYNQHIGWTRIEEMICDEYEKRKSQKLTSGDIIQIKESLKSNSSTEELTIRFGLTTDKIKAYHLDLGEFIADFDKFYAEIDTICKEMESKRNYAKKNNNSPEKTSENETSYEKFEYNRLSSIAKQIYQENIDKTLTTCLYGGNAQICDCENCIRRKKSEHQRWNAYTRIIGYSYDNGIKNYRAKLHSDLVGWSDLSYYSKQKD